MSSDEEKVRVVKNATDLQRLKLEKLMKNPEKLAFIPEKSKDKKFPSAPEFVRNVMGSSAGAGSGEFHVYRHIRRREYARQEYLNQMTEKERLDHEYHEKLEQNSLRTEAKAAKKRAKRLRAKQRQKDKKRKGSGGQPIKDGDSSGSESEEEEEEHDGQQVENNRNDLPEKDTSNLAEGIGHHSEEIKQTVGVASAADESNGSAVQSVATSVEEETVSSCENAEIPIVQRKSLQETASTNVNETTNSAADKPTKKSLKELLDKTVSKLNAKMNCDDR